MEHLFNFFVAGIEDGMIAALGQRFLVENGGYVKRLGSYGGELDEDNMKRALSELMAGLPMMLVAYAEGEDKLSPAVTAVPPGSPRFYEHHCTFNVVCVSGDLRKEEVRRRRVYQMIDDVWATLTDVQFKAQVGDELVLLNREPLRPAGVTYIARLPQMTAYAVNFDTFFRYSSPDRTTTGSLVQEVIIDVDNTYQKGEANRPGVVLD